MLPDATPRSTPFERLLVHLRKRLTEPLPGTTAQLTMSPPERRHPERRSIQGKSCREGAVLALLFPMNMEAGLTLTVRPDTLADHAGQISFPGGRREPDESLAETALREAWEEVGVEPEQVILLGELTPLYIPPSNFCVYPHVGALTERPSFQINPHEVQALIEVPIARLLQPDVRKEKAWTLGHHRMQVPYYDIDGHVIWGATAMMLAELLAVISDFS